MKLIVGLGNPGKQYEKTYHNIGFMVIDNYIKTNKIETPKEKFNGEYVQFENDGEKIILLKPLSYMNLSGEIVKKYVDYYKIDYSDILIISDDLDQEFMNYKLKYKGSCGGHNGLRNIEDNLKTDQYKRLKIGIGKNKDIDGKDYVLSKLSKEEQNKIIEMLPVFNAIIDDFIEMDFERLMNKYN